MKSRIHAFLTHLFISLIILLLALSTIFFFWFPKELIHAGGITGLKIIIGVDLILGPLLTFVVYKPNKKSLVFDLFCIGILQLACLFYGLWLVYNQRPVLEVIANDGVHLISASDAKYHSIKLETIPGKYPKKVMMKLPPDQSLWNSVIFASEFTGNKPFSLEQSLYLPINSVTEEKYKQRINIISTKTETPNVANNNCTWVAVFSVHLGSNSLACVNKKNGIVKLRDR